MLFLKFIYAVFGITLGIGILKYRKTVYDWTGKFYWAEKYLGSGGTIIIITLVGLGLIFVSMIYPFGAFDSLKSDPIAGKEQTSNNPTDSSME